MGLKRNSLSWQQRASNGEPRASIDATESTWTPESSGPGAQRRDRRHLSRLPSEAGRVSLEPPQASVSCRLDEGAARGPWPRRDQQDLTAEDLTGGNGRGPGACVLL